MPVRQATLSFKPKAEKEEELSAKENDDPEEGARNEPVVKAPLTRLIDSKKRVRKVETGEDSKASVKIEKEDEDGSPVAKRARRSRLKIEDDSDMEDVVPSIEPKTEDGPSAETAIKKEEDEESVKEEVESESASEDDIDEKPAVVEKARKLAQTQLKSTTKDPFPDWKAGDPVPYAALCTTFSLIELTTKRLIIMEHCSLFLRQVMRLTPADLLPTVLLMINKLAPDYAGIELGIGESLIMKAIGESTGRSLQVIKADQKEIGDLGLVALKSRSTQPTMFKPKPLTVRGVLQGLMGIATVTGNGAQGRKVDGIKKLLSASDAHNTGKIDITKDKGGPSEAKYLIRFLEGKLRLGLAERTVLVSLAQAAVCHEASLKSKVPSTTDLENGESILKSTYRYVSCARRANVLANDVEVNCQATTSLFPP